MLETLVKGDTSVHDNLAEAAVWERYFGRNIYRAA